MIGNRKEASRSAFDRMAAEYDHSRVGVHARRHDQPLLEQISRFPFWQLLDVGCGTGELLKQLAALYPQKQLTGVDLSEKMVEQARRKLPAQVTVLAGDGERLPFPAGSFDLVTCCDSFHHYPDPRRAAEEFCRVLRPGGQVILCEYWQPGPARWLMNALLPYSSEGDVRIYSRRELAALLTQGGFAEVAVKKTGPTAVMALGQRPTKS